MNVSHGRSMRTIEGNVFVDSQDIHYLYRNSNKLCYLSLLEYACIVNYKPRPDNINNRSTGRQQNLIILYDKRYSLHNKN